MNDDRHRIAAVLTEAAKAVHSPRTLEETLDAIVHAARDTVPGFEHVGVSIVHKSGELETKAGTGQLVWELDELQYSFREGPCYDALHAEPVMMMESAEREERWPNYTPKAVEKGLRSQFGLRLYTEEETLGTLNLYSTSSEGIDPDALQLAELFATHAAIAIGRSRFEHQLQESVSSRQVIGTAVGIIMQRYEVTEERAFQFLVRASSTSNIKMRTIAQEVVDTANADFGPEE